MSKKISTLADMAKLAGVSESTVSRALSGSKLVSDKTRERIQAMAHEMDFSINTSARNLRLQKSNTIAVVLLINSDQDQSPTDPFILGLIGVITEELAKRGYDMLLASHKRHDKLWLSRYFDSKRADGVIIFGQGQHADTFEEAITEDMPLVVWGAKCDGARYLTVGTDNYLGGQLATEHLLEKGCEHIAFAGNLTMETSLRFQGFKDAMAKNKENAQTTHLDIHFTYADAYEVTKQLINEGKFPYDGIVASSDIIALGMLKAVKENPAMSNRPFAIVGYDDIEVASYTDPSLTTVRQDTYAGGRQLVECLFQQINKQDTQACVLETKLIERESSLLNP